MEEACGVQIPSKLVSSQESEQKCLDSSNKSVRPLSKLKVCKYSPIYSPGISRFQPGRSAVVRVTPLRVRGALFPHDLQASQALAGSAGPVDPWSGVNTPKQCSMTIENTTGQEEVSSVGQLGITVSAVQSPNSVERLNEWSVFQEGARLSEQSGVLVGNCSCTVSNRGESTGVPSDWRRAILGLRDSLMAARSSYSEVESESESRKGLRTRRARDRFYEEFQRLSQVAATKTLRTWGWQGDINHDAEEVASECVVNLLRQEEQGKGIFQAPEEALPQYLSGVIWRGVKQRIGERKGREERFWHQVPLELVSEIVPDSKVSKVLLKISLEEAIQKIAEEERRIYKLPEGVVPLDGVLDKAVAKAIIGKVPKRSWQRYVRNSRLRLGEELGMW